MADRRAASLSIRPYRSSDLRELITLFAAAVSDLARAHYDRRQRWAWSSSAQDVDTWRSRLSEGVTLVAEIGGAPAGFITYSETGHVDLLFTAPEYARCGIASQLYRCAEDQLRDAGIEQIHTEASKVARCFFERMGFVKVKKEVVEVKGIPLMRFRMHKNIH
ncbi:MAG: GNAT family N-acetyltransferase [Marinobacter sp.]|nr:GNAT family N-acetyltransferase [Marinobacter sp.]